MCSCPVYVHVFVTVLLYMVSVSAVCVCLCFWNFLGTPIKDLEDPKGFDSNSFLRASYKK